MATQVIGQQIINNNTQQGINLFQNLQVTKVGIQGPPGTQFTFTKGNSITLGQYGIYELDISEVGFLTYLEIEHRVSDKPIYIDYIYYQNENTGGGIT